MRRRGVDGRDPERRHMAFPPSDLGGIREQLDGLTGELPKRRDAPIFARQRHWNTRSFVLFFP